MPSLNTSFKAPRLVLGLAVALIFIAPAAAQDYPTRAVTLIIPYPAGGGVDTVGRIIAAGSRRRSASRSSSRTVPARAR